MSGSEPSAAGPDREERRKESIQRNKEVFSDSPYFADAERGMAWQWEHIIWPRIRAGDFRCVLELAPGHGRNSERLAAHAEELHLVDLNAPCIDACRRRFARYEGPCRIRYHVNDGESLDAIADGSVTLVYSWDAVVHMDRTVVAAYLREFARVLVPGGHGFVHHSHWGSREPASRFQENPSWRSNGSRESFAEDAAAAGLLIVSQELLDWDGVPELDCISIFQRPGSPSESTQPRV